MLSSRTFTFLSLSISALATPVAFEKRQESCNVSPFNNGIPARCNSADPPFTQIESLMFANINCGSVGVAGASNPFLLVPGTGNTGAESFQGGYVQLLQGLGFNPCFLVEPQAMLNDAQETDERIAYAINTLATVAGKPIPVAGWSQGNLDIQWVLTFWTSARTNTLQFVSLAGDFRGTTSAEALGVANFLIPLPPSLRQQEAGSFYLTALSRHGGLSAKVPTTSIFSSTDEVIMPESTSTSSTSFLSGSNVGNVLIQSICPGLDVSHEDQLFINFSFQLLKAAVSSPNHFVTPSQVAALRIPCNTNAAPGANPNQGIDAIGFAVASIAAAELTAQATLFEPPLRAYAL